MPSTLASRRPLEAEARVPRSRALLRLGVRQVAVLRATSASIACAPTIDDCAGCIERARDQLLQLERTAVQYMEHTQASLLADAEQVLGELPALGSWVEAMLAQLLLSLATQVELEHAREQGTCESPALAVLASATEHVHAARAALHEAGALHTNPRRTSDAATAHWLTIALGTLEDESTRAAYRRALERASQSTGIDLTH